MGLAGEKGKRVSQPCPAVSPCPIPLGRSPSPISCSATPSASQRGAGLSSEPGKGPSAVALSVPVPLLPQMRLGALCPLVGHVGGTVGEWGAAPRAALPTTSLFPAGQGRPGWADGTARATGE